MARSFVRRYMYYLHYLPSLSMSDDDDRDFGWRRRRLCGEEHGKQEKITRQVPAKLERTGVEPPPPCENQEYLVSESERVSHDQADSLRR